MDGLRKCCLIIVLCWSSCFASGSLLKSLEHLPEAELARFLDSVAQPPPRTSGFEELVPEEDIRFFCTKPGVSHFQQVSLEDDSSVGSKIDLSRPLVVVTHGWTETTNRTAYQEMAARFRQYVPDINCCLLDWQPYAAFTYEIAARRGVPLVAERLSKLLLLLSKRSYALSKVSLVGFSMGGQIAGLAGKTCAGRVGAIFALDPAGPLFTHPFDVGPRNRLSKTDARYVQVIATSRYALGVGPLVGTQNFLPSGGFHPQKKCLSLTITKGEILGFRCSHEYARELFTATLDPTNVIYGQKCINLCPNLFWLQSGFCRDRVGFFARRVPGNFCL